MKKRSTAMRRRTKTKKFITKWKIGKESVNSVLRRADELSGACLIFIGRVRADKIDGKKVKEIYYDCYDDMAEEECKKIKEEAERKFGVREVLIKHRVGRVKVGEIALFVGVISSHRKEGFSALQYVVENVKKRVPIWKKEIFQGGGERWREN